MDSYKKLFATYGVEPSSALYNKIITAIERRKIRQAKIRVFTWSFIGCISLGVLLPAVRYLSLELYQSGLYHYISITLSDGSILANNWKEIGWVFAESIPVTGLIATLLSTVVLLESFKLIISNIKTYKVSLWPRTLA